MINLTQTAIEQILNGEMDADIIAFVTEQYSYGMHDKGLSRQALDFLIAQQPGIDDPSVFPDNWTAIILQAYSFSLWADVLNAKTFRENAIEYIALLDDKLEGWRDGKDAVVVASIWLGDMQTAKSVFFEEFDELRADHEWWDTIFESDMLAEFREEPDVAARLAEVMREKNRLREEVRQMLQEPEWQH